MSKEAMKLACKTLRDCHYYMINAGLPNQSLLNEAFTAYMELEAALAEQPAQQEPVADKHQAFIDSLPSDMEDKMFMQIDYWARQSYARHLRSTGGQMITAADSSETHIIWAALRWAKENAATPQAQPAQRPWVGLTEQEAAECWSISTVRTWKAIEAKLKEKNT